MPIDIKMIPETHLELFLGCSRLEVVQECNYLDETEDAERGHVLAGTQGLETDKGYLHTADQPHYVERAVR